MVSQVKTLASTSSSSAQPELTQLALSPDGKQLAAGHTDGTLRLWDFEAAELEHVASGHRSGISALCYSQNGALLASGGQDTEIVVWDVTSGTPLYRLQGHLGQVTALVSKTKSPSACRNQNFHDASIFGQLADFTHGLS